MSELIVRGGRVFGAGDEPRDIRVEAGRIAEVGVDLAVPAGVEVLDATGLSVLPGAIDNHVHFRDPGLTHKEDYGSGSHGALRGGVTTVLEVQNNDPLLLDAERCRSKIAEVGTRSLVNFAIYPNLVPQTIDTLQEMAPFAAAYKLYMGASTGMGGMNDYGEMRELFKAAAATGRPVVLHCEEESILDHTTKLPGLTARDHGSIARPPVSEAISIAAAIEMAREWGTNIHVFHLSTKRGLDLIKRARDDGITVGCSTCPHYLHFTEDDAGELGNLLKVNPAVHTAEDREGLIDGLAAGDIEIFSTDHAPHTREEKDKPYAKAPSGIPSVDLFYPMLLTLVARGRVSLERAIDSVGVAPAELHGLGKRGRIEPGWHADLCVVDLDEARTVTKADLSSRSGYTPYEGRELIGWPVATVVGGNVGWDRRRAQPFDEGCRGRYLAPDTDD